MCHALLCMIDYNCLIYVRMLVLCIYSTWIRFGSAGFTLPLGTEHAARCQYSSRRMDCPVPWTCEVLNNYDERNMSSIASLCDEMPLIN